MIGVCLFVNWVIFGWNHNVTFPNNGAHHFTFDIDWKASMQQCEHL